MGSRGFVVRPSGSIGGLIGKSMILSCSTFPLMTLDLALLSAGDETGSARVITSRAVNNVKL